MNNTLSNISFGMNLPTRKVIALATKQNLYDSNFNDNIELVHKMVQNKYNYLPDRGLNKCIGAFETAAGCIMKQFPQLQPTVDELRTVINGYKKGYKLEIEKILQNAEEKFGKELDVSTAEIEKLI